MPATRQSRARIRSARPRPDAFSSYGGDLQVGALGISLPMFKSLLVVGALCGVASGLFASGGGGGCAGGGGAGFCGFGDSGYPFELPKVEEDVIVGGLTLKLDRTKWGYSVFGAKGDGALARFIGDDIEVTLTGSRRRLTRGEGLSKPWPLETMFSMPVPWLRPVPCAE